jgi:DNA-directed RNA polymerase subunit M/transcription elongation factor TFIIS
MNFCKQCNSYLIAKEIDEVLKYECSVCGEIEDCNNDIIDSKIYKEKELIRGDNNKYIIYDNTLPRTKKKKCPNDTCESTTNTDIRDVIMLTDKYTQKLYYTCCVCNTEWSYS